MTFPKKCSIIEQREGGDVIKSIQTLIPISDIFEDGIIKSKDRVLKIIQVIPQNLNFTSNFEKEVILNSYKLLLNIYTFNFQVVVKSSTQNLENIKKRLETKNKNNIEKEKLYFKFIEYISGKELEALNRTKSFYIVIEEKFDDKLNIEECKAKLNNNCIKLKEYFRRKGTGVLDICSKVEIISVLKEFFQPII